MRFKLGPIRNSTQTKSSTWLTYFGVVQDSRSGPSPFELRTNQRRQLFYPWLGFFVLQFSPDLTDYKTSLTLDLYLFTFIVYQKNQLFFPFPFLDPIPQRFRNSVIQPLYHLSSAAIA